MRISVRCVLLGILFLFFSKPVEAQREIFDISNPDYNKLNLVYEILYNPLGNSYYQYYVHYNQFFSSYAKHKKAKLIKRVILYKDSALSDYTSGRVSLNFYKNGFISEEIIINFTGGNPDEEHLKSGDTDRVVTYSYSNEGRIIKVAEKRYDSVKRSKDEKLLLEKVFYFGKNRMLDSIRYSQYLSGELQVLVNRSYQYNKQGYLNRMIVPGDTSYFEYKKIELLHRIDPIFLDSIKNKTEFDFIKKELSGNPDSSIEMISSARGDEGNYIMIVNFKGSYIYRSFIFEGDGSASKTKIATCFGAYKLYKNKIDVSANLAQYPKVRRNNMDRTSYMTFSFVKQDRKRKSIFISYEGNKQEGQSYFSYNLEADFEKRKESTKIFKSDYQIIK